MTGPDAIGSPCENDLVWYVTYGSNMHAARFACYLSGGTPPGGARTYPGCRDSQPARDTRPVWLSGEMYFALESKVWGGGMAFYDPDRSGSAAARAYLITAGQFADIVAQEMHREPNKGLDLETVIATGRSQLGPGRYETLLLPEWLDQHPMLTFTAPWQTHEVELNAPSGRYLRMLGGGLRETHNWDTRQVAEYLAKRPGAHGVWTPAAIADALARVGGP